jgi:hypothetical protein
VGEKGWWENNLADPFFHPHTFFFSLIKKPSFYFYIFFVISHFLAKEDTFFLLCDVTYNIYIFFLTIERFSSRSPSHRFSHSIIHRSCPLLHLTLPMAPRCHIQRTLSKVVLFIQFFIFLPVPVKIFLDFFLLGVSAFTILYNRCTPTAIAPPPLSRFGCLIHHS